MKWYYGGANARLSMVASGLILLAACATAPPPPIYQPYESLMQILADLQMHVDDDIYRFGQPRDIAGKNLFRATLERLKNYEATNPGAFPDVIAVSKAKALE